MKKIIYTRPDGGISILTISPQESVAELIPGIEELSYEEYVNFIKEKDVPEDALNIRIVDESEIPTDRTHRNEWVDKGDKVEPDPVKVQKKVAAQSKLEEDKEATYYKLGISKEEFEKLNEVNAEVVKLEISNSSEDIIK